MSSVEEQTAVQVANLGRVEATERLRATTGMATHRVRITGPDELDAQLVGWLREAYERA